MSIVAGYFNSKNEKASISALPNFSSTSIEDHYQDSRVSFQSITQQSSPSTSPALFYDAASQIVILADTHLLDRHNLCKQLAKPFSIDTASDAELILYAYQKWQENCANYLTGNFAFAIWDIKTQQLILARDISGQRSLFYYIDAKQTFYFASLPRFLSELPGFQKKINPGKIADFLTLLPGDNHATCFEGIYAVPAAHILILKTTDPSPLIKRYWSAYQIMQNPLSFKSQEEYYEAFQALFREVISDYIASQETVVTHLSGGLDSSAVTCMAADLLQSKNKKLSALCHIPTAGNKPTPSANWTYDDTPYMQAVAAQYPNVSNHYITADNSRLFDYCAAIHPWLDAPLMNPLNNLWLLECTEKAKALGAAGILTGARGNSTLSWSGLKPPPPTFSIRYIRRYLSSIKINFLEKLLAYNPLKLQPWQHFSGINPTLAHRTGLFKNYHQRNNIKRRLSTADYRSYYCHHMIDAFSTAAFANTIRFLYGIEWLDPTADKRIIEFCLRTPPEIFCNQHQSRLLLRKGMGNLLPQCIRDRTSRGMQAADWCKKVEKQKTELKNTLVSWKNSPIAHYIDIGDLLKELDQWDVNKIERSDGKKYLSYASKYQNKLLRSIELGLFIQHHLT